jgi:hypothetical protein
VPADTLAAEPPSACAAVARAAHSVLVRCSERARTRPCAGAVAAVRPACRRALTAWLRATATTHITPRTGSVSPPCCPPGAACAQPRYGLRARQQGHAAAAGGAVRRRRGGACGASCRGELAVQRRDGAPRGCQRRRVCATCVAAEPERARVAGCALAPTWLAVPGSHAPACGARSVVNPTSCDARWPRYAGTCWRTARARWCGSNCLLRRLRSCCRSLLHGSCTAWARAGRRHAAAPRCAPWACGRAAPAARAWSGEGAHQLCASRRARAAGYAPRRAALMPLALALAGVRDAAARCRATGPP